MTSNDVDDDPVLEALGRLHTRDVDTRRAHRLHVRCRAALAAQKRAADTVAAAGSARWTLVVGPVLLAAWCAIYVIEIARLAWAIYRL
jgi:uncharacterized membrane protein